MIKVCDAFMGAGKTSAAINYMRRNPEKHFIYITPYYDETVRIRDACPDLNFSLPSNAHEEYDHAKRNHLKALLKDERNVSITHALFKLCDNETVDLIKEKKYVIIIDEVVDIFNKLEITNSDLALILSSGWLQAEEVGDATIYTYDIESAPHKYQGGRYMDLFIYASAQRLTEIKTGDKTRNLWYWTLHDSLFSGDNEIIILSFMFKGSIMAAFLEANMVEYSYIGVKKFPPAQDGGMPIFEFVDTPQCPPDHIANLGKMINIVDNPKMNAIGDKVTALSSNWYNTRMCNDRNGDLETLRKHASNFFRNMHSDCPKEHRLWSTYSSARGKIKGPGYRDAFLAFTTKATNDYKQCNVLAYLVNIYNDPNIRLYLANRGAAINDNDYALSTMVQWIWRSAIRDGKPIHLYLPSRRMRTLLKKWIADSEEQYRSMKASSL